MLVMTYSAAWSTVDNHVAEPVTGHAASCTVAAAHTAAVVVTVDTAAAHAGASSELRE